MHRFPIVLLFLFATIALPFAVWGDALLIKPPNCPNDGDHL